MKTQTLPRCMHRPRLVRTIFDCCPTMQKAGDCCGALSVQRRSTLITHESHYLASVDQSARTPAVQSHFLFQSLRCPSSMVRRLLHYPRVTHRGLLRSTRVPINYSGSTTFWIVIARWSRIRLRRVMNDAIFPIVWSSVAGSNFRSSFITGLGNDCFDFSENFSTVPKNTLSFLSFQESRY